MNRDGRSFINLVGGLLTHAWSSDYGFTDEELKRIDEAISILLEVRDGEEQ